MRACLAVMMHNNGKLLASDAAGTPPKPAYKPRGNSLRVNTICERKMAWRPAYFKSPRFLNQTWCCLTSASTWLGMPAHLSGWLQGKTMTDLTRSLARYVANPSFDQAQSQATPLPKLGFY